MVDSDLFDNISSTSYQTVRRRLQQQVRKVCRFETAVQTQSLIDIGDVLDDMVAVTTQVDSCCRNATNTSSM